MIQAGKLRHYAAIEVFVQTGVGPRGQKTGNWQAIHSDIPMSIVPLGGSLAEIKRQLVPKATHQIWLRWIDGIKAGETRVNYSGRFFNVGYVDEGDFKQHDLGLICTEVAEETVNC